MLQDEIEKLKAEKVKKEEEEKKKREEEREQRTKAREERHKERDARGGRRSRSRSRYILQPSNIFTLHSKKNTQRYTKFKHSNCEKLQWFIKQYILTIVGSSIPINKSMLKKNYHKNRDDFNKFCLKFIKVSPWLR